jgi:hypothetical protein
MMFLRGICVSFIGQSERDKLTDRARRLLGLDESTDYAYDWGLDAILEA